VPGTFFVLPHYALLSWKTQFAAFYRTTNRNNAGGWRVRGVAKHFMNSPPQTAQKLLKKLAKGSE